MPGPTIYSSVIILLGVKAGTKSEWKKIKQTSIKTKKIKKDRCKYEVVEDRQLKIKNIILKGQLLFAGGNFVSIQKCP